jgi:dipeptidyl aminopeptidase/acylaminoacyl peptidase
MYSLGLTASGTLYVHRRINTRDVAIAPIDLQAGTFLRPPTGFKQGFGAGAQNPAWSPDGKHLAYPVDCRDGCVAIRSVATGEMRRVGATLTESRVVDWSSDGQSLLMKSRDATGRDGVFRIDVASGQAAPIFLSDGLSVVAHWSPDGRKIYFNRRGMFVERDLTTGTERDVSDDTGELFGALSPDGRYFAVARADRVANTTSLLLVPVNGGQTREVLRLMPPEGLFRPGEGAWTPDSAALIVQKHTGSRWELWFVPVTGAPPRKLAIDPAIWREGIAVSTSGAVRVFQGDGAFSLSPDGRTAAVVIGRAVNEVWALENFMPAPTRSR